MKDSVNLYSIADFLVCVAFAESKYNGEHLIPSLNSFKKGAHTKEKKDHLLFSITVDDTLKPIKKERRERIRTFDTGNGDTIVDAVDDGGYQFIIKDIRGFECCLLITNKDFSTCKCALNGNYDMRSFGLNNALMLAYAFAGSFKKTLLIHASLVRNNNKGYAFTAKSGTGKSTHVSLWLRNIPNCDLMNDDNPIIRIIDGKPYIYGGPWSGKTPCYRDIKAPLGAITRIDRAKENSIEKLSNVEAFATLLPSCSSMKWDSDIFNNICNAITDIIKTTNIYTLHCLPNKEAAILCHRTLTENQR